LQLIGPWVIGGGGVDTERSLHFNYSHQLSRKSYKQHSTNNSHPILTTPPSNQCEAAAIVSRRHRCGAAAIVAESPPSLLKSHRCRLATAIAVEPPLLSWIRRHRC